MNNRMSYNDVQQLKSLIRNRLQEAANMQNGGMSYGMPSFGGQRPPVPNGGQRPPVPNGKFAQANNMASYTMNGQGQSQQPMRQPMQSQQVQQSADRSRIKEAPKRANNAAPSLDKQIAGKVTKPTAGAHFEKYDCGHPYPKMSVRQHLKEEMGKSRNERIDNLRYAYVMSEILSEPVCKRRRSARNMY